MQTQIMDAKTKRGANTAWSNVNAIIACAAVGVFSEGYLAFLPANIGVLWGRED
jgi:hypothetical protein